jgi:CheY-like chemotaxis protein
MNEILKRRIDPATFMRVYEEIKTPLLAIENLAEVITYQESTVQEQLKSAYFIKKSVEYITSVLEYEASFLGYVETPAKSVKVQQRTSSVTDPSKADQPLKINDERCSLVDLLSTIELVTEWNTRSKAIPFALDINFPLPEYIQKKSTQVRSFLVCILRYLIHNAFSKEITLKIRWEKSKSSLIFDLTLALIPDFVNKFKKIFFDENPEIVQDIVESVNTELLIEGKKQLSAEVAIEEITDGVSKISVILPTGDLKASANVINEYHCPTIVIPEYKLLFSGRVLLAEEDPIDHEFFTIIFEKYGLTVTHAFDGYTAARTALAGQFDLIFMNTELPKLDGQGATKYLREKGIQTSIVLVSNAESSKERDECIHAGANEYAPKPIKKDGLIGIFKRYLQHGSGLYIDDNGQSVGKLFFKEQSSLLGFAYKRKLTTMMERLEKAFQEDQWTTIHEVANVLSSAGLFGYSEIGYSGRALLTKVLKKEKDEVYSLMTKIREMIEKSSVVQPPQTAPTIDKEEERITSKELAISDKTQGETVQENTEQASATEIL